MSEQIPSNESMFRTYVPDKYARKRVARMRVEHIANLVARHRQGQPDGLSLDDYQIAGRVRDAARGIPMSPESMTDDQWLLARIVNLQWRVIEQETEVSQHLKSIRLMIGFIGLLFILALGAFVFVSCVGLPM